MEPALDIRSGTDAEGVAPLIGADDDTVRANTYGLLGALLASPLLARRVFDLLAEYRSASSDEGLGPVLARARDMPRSRADVEAVDDEYHDLFVGVGRGELLPYGSWYQTGFVMDKPLAVLRSDLAALGFERRDEVKEPEDHAAALLETMALIVASPEHGIDVQRRFFDRHVATWMRTFFADLQHRRLGAVLPGGGTVRRAIHGI